MQLLYFVLECGNKIFTSAAGDGQGLAQNMHFVTKYIYIKCWFQILYLFQVCFSGDETLKL